ncbi:MAG: hypothetical protein ACRC46_01410 [Thermoguttaceae bacterium]
MPVSQHAKERACQRYGVVFSQRQWLAFTKALRNSRLTVRLRDNRWACYFERCWYLVVRTDDGVLLTFLPREDATDDDKAILQHAENYCRINVDAFKVGLTGSTTASCSAAATHAHRKKVPLPPKQLADSDNTNVMQDFDQHLKNLCTQPMKTW